MTPGHSFVADRALRLARVVVVVVLATGGARPSAWAQAEPVWTSLGPPGGAVSAMLVSPASPATLYAGTPGNGVFVSNDGGASWSPANAGLQAAVVGSQVLFDVHALAADAQFAYAATDAGLYYTALGGTPAWTALPDTGAAAPVTLLAFDPASGWLFAASPAADAMAVPGVYVMASVAAGTPAASWSFVPLPLAATGLAIDGLAVVPGASGPGSLMASAGGQVYATTIGTAASMAASWTNADPSGTLASGNVAALAYSPAFLQSYACSAGQLWTSGNAPGPGALWSPASVASAGMTAPVCNAVAAIPVAAGGLPQLMLGTDQGAFVSLDGADFAATQALGPGAGANAFAVGQVPGSTGEQLYVGSDFGVATAPVAAVLPGVAWTASNGPAAVVAGAASGRLDNTDVVDTATLGTQLFAAAADVGYSDVFVSADGGATWAPTGIGSVLGIGGAVLVLLADEPDRILYAGTTQGLLAYDAASGAWSAVGGGAIGGRASALALGAGALFVGTDQGVVALPLGRAPASATPVVAGLAGASVRSLLVDSGILFAGTIDASDDNNYVYFTTAAGAAQGTGQWQPFAQGSAGTGRITSLLFVGTTLIAATNGNLVLYASLGSGWASANTSADPAQQVADTFGNVTSLFSDGATVYAATASRGVFATPAGAGFSWRPFDGAGATALPSMEVHRLRGGNGVLYAATRGGVAGFVDAALAPPPPPSAPSSAPSSSAGGGAVDAWLVLPLLVALLALGHRVPRNSVYGRWSER